MGRRKVEAGGDVYGAARAADAVAGDARAQGEAARSLWAEAVRVAKAKE